MVDQCGLVSDIAKTYYKQMKSAIKLIDRNYEQKLPKDDIKVDIADVLNKKLVFKCNIVGGNPTKTASACKACLENVSTRTDDDVYQFISVIQDYLHKNGNLTENHDVLARLLTVTKIALDTIPGKIDKYVMNILRESETVISVAFSIPGRTKKQIELEFSDPFNKLVSEMIQLKPNSTITIKYTLESSMDPQTGASVPSGEDVFTLELNIGTDGAVTATKYIDNFSGNSEEEFDEIDTYWADTLQEITSALFSSKGGALKKSLRISAKVRKHFQVPTKYTGNKAFEFISKHYSKAQIASFLQVSQNTRDTKARLLEKLSKC